MKNRRTKVLYIIFFIAAVFFAAFVLIEFRKDYLAVALAAIVMLIAAYFLVDSIERDIYAKYDLEQKDINEKLDETVEEITRGSKRIDQLQDAILRASMQGLSKPEEKLTEISEHFEQAEQKINHQIEDRNSATITTDLLQKQQELMQNQKELISLVKMGFKTLIQYSKENARQVALNTNENTEKLMNELDTSIKTILDGLENKVSNEEDIHKKMTELSQEILQSTYLVNQSLEQIQDITKKISEELHHE